MRTPVRAAAGLVAALLLAGCASAASRVRTPPDLDGISGEMAQRYTILAMLRIAAANAAARIDTGSYVANLAGLSRGGYLDDPILEDAWGEPFMYTTGADTYSVVSYGSDGAAGPAPPQGFWEFGEATDVDIVLTDGVFTLVPGFPTLSGAMEAKRPLR